MCVDDVWSVHVEFNTTECLKWHLCSFVRLEGVLFRFCKLSFMDFKQRSALSPHGIMFCRNYRRKKWIAMPSLLFIAKAIYSLHNLGKSKQFSVIYRTSHRFTYPLQDL